MNTQTTCERCGKAVGCSEWDIHTCTPPAQPATEDSSAVQPAPVQEPVSVILSQWKSGAIGATEAILELFKHYSSNPSISATQQTAQQAVPEGYALIGIDALKAWGKYDLVKSMCMFPVDPPAAHRQQKPAAEITGVDECGPMLGWYEHWINFPVGTRFYTTPPAAPVQSLPFGVGGGLVAIKALLSRDPCAHATVAIQMIDAILAEHSPQKANTP